MIMVLGCSALWPSADEGSGAVCNSDAASLGLAWPFQAFYDLAVALNTAGVVVEYPGLGYKQLQMNKAWI
ncbi:hypothetical protein HaLaN_07340 [Haematococcus lacustris]|uniref:Uncharacterized protein n=1 Tax=Haematococcus lacustris TaxID=44745 RepID=A0A699YYE3_HAELA|nr:hypothetical protein HaLaN_07340 [Haematococcus lacustris]